MLKTKRPKCKQTWLPPPVGVIEVALVVDHAEWVVEVGVDHFST